MIRLSFSRSGLLALSLVALAVIALSTPAIQSVAVDHRAMLLSQPPDYHPLAFVIPEAAIERATLGLRSTLPIDDHVFRKVNREALHNGKAWEIERNFGGWRLV